MSRFFGFVAIAALFALPAAAQNANLCNLQISISCRTAAGGSTACTSTTINAGARACSGMFYSAFFAQGTGQVTHFTNSLGLSECFDNSSFPVTAGESFAFCFGMSSLAPNASFTASADVTGTAQIFAETYVADPNSDNYAFVYAQANATAPTCTPVISSPPVTQSGLSYQVTWTAISDPTAQFIVDESTTPDFSSNVTSTQVNALLNTYRHDVSNATTYYYRVKATNCASGTPAYSGVSRTIVQAPSPATSKNPEVTVPVGTTQPVSIPVFIPGPGGNTTFVATTDKPYLTVSPSSGTLPPSGTTVTVTASPGSLPPGTSTGTLKVAETTGTSTTTKNTPIQISIVTPVNPTGKNTPPPNALVIPVVTHVNAGAGPFLSDVRLANASGQPASYLVTMAPAGSDALTNSKATTITVGSQETAALNDIVKNFFGFGATGAASDTAYGSLEIRPIDSASPLNFAASRTYASTANGTFGQFVAAVPFSKFATLTPPVVIPGAPPAHTATKLSLQQLAQSARFRTNFGLAEGSGQPASGTIRIFDDAGNVVKEAPFNLAAGEAKQYSLPRDFGVTSLDDGRIEVEIASPTGAVTAYASVLDQTTTDPFAVAPVDVSAISSTRYILPGISEFTNPTSNFHSDVRLFNGGTSDVTATLTFYPIAGLPGADAKTVTIPRGQILKLDNILPTLFKASATAGSIVVTTPTPSSLVATANTFSNAPGGGTFGQFIPGVLATEGTAVGERPLQILQLEQSDQFRSNVGVFELTGNQVHVELTLYMPDSKVTPFYSFELGPNQFTQLNSVISQFLGQSGQTYNGRVAIAVTGGTGRVAAYGSVIDHDTSDPTFVPHQ